MENIIYYVRYIFRIFIIEKRFWSFQQNFSYSSYSLSENYTKKKYLYIWYLFQVWIYRNWLIQPLTKWYHTNDQFLLYKKSNIDIWNSNNNINIRNFHHVVVEYNIFVIPLPIIWYSKIHNTVENSTFWEESVALRIVTNLLISLRYKLIIIGVPIEGADVIFCDNEYVYRNASFYESHLNIKHQAICFHQSSECMASDKIIFHWVDTNNNFLICWLSHSLVVRIFN